MGPTLAVSERSTGASVRNERMVKFVVWLVVVGMVLSLAIAAIGVFT